MEAQQHTFLEDSIYRGIKQEIHVIFILMTAGNSVANHYCQPDAAGKYINFYFIYVLL